VSLDNDKEVKAYFIDVVGNYAALPGTPTYNSIGPGYYHLYPGGQVAQNWHLASPHSYSIMGVTTTPYYDRISGADLPPGVLLNLMLGPYGPFPATVSFDRQVLTIHPEVRQFHRQ
jgi:hypothetical protein